jgi:hypothetical protein
LERGSVGAWERWNVEALKRWNVEAVGALKPWVR